MVMLNTSKHFCDDACHDKTPTTTRRSSVRMGVSTFVKRLSSLRVVSESSRRPHNERRHSTAIDSGPSSAHLVNDSPPIARRPSTLQKAPSQRPTSSLSFIQPSRKGKGRRADFQGQRLPVEVETLGGITDRPDNVCCDPQLRYTSNLPDHIAKQRREDHRRREDLEPITALFETEDFPAIVADEQEVSKTDKRRGGQRTLDEYFQSTPASFSAKSAGKKPRDPDFAGRGDEESLVQRVEEQSSRRIHFAETVSTSSRSSSAMSDGYEGKHMFQPHPRVRHIPAEATSSSSSRSTSRLSTSQFSPEDYNVPYISKQMARRLTTATIAASSNGSESPYPLSSTDGSEDGHCYQRGWEKKGGERQSSRQTSRRAMSSSNSRAEGRAGRVFVGEVTMGNFPALCLLKDNKEAYEEWMEMVRRESA